MENIGERILNELKGKKLIFKDHPLINDDIYKVKSIKFCYVSGEFLNDGVSFDMHLENKKSGKLIYHVESSFFGVCLFLPEKS